MSQETLIPTALLPQLIGDPAGLRKRNYPGPCSGQSLGDFSSAQGRNPTGQRKPRRVAHTIDQHQTPPVIAQVLRDKVVIMQIPGQDAMRQEESGKLLICRLKPPGVNTSGG
ncbi:MAG: hypothetical protein NZ804_13415 [Roseibacillus sp.]|nr:hypothetical protein [Roseibacillus sp.]